MMKGRFSLRKISIIAVILISVLGILFFGAVRQINTPFTSSIVINTLAPFQSGVAYVGDSLARFKNYIVEIFYIYDVNRELKAENEKLKLQMLQDNDLVVENQHLTQLLNYKTSHPEFNLQAARIVSRDTATWSNHIIINVGRNDGVEKNMPVVTPDGLVGHIDEAYSSYSEVELITDPRSAVSAIVQRADSRLTGVVKGVADSSSSINLNNIPQYANIKTGDTIITSGLSGIYPKGIVIGSVYKLETTAGGLLQYAVLYPAVNFQSLENVFVIKNPPHIDMYKEIQKDIANGKDKV